MAQTTLYRWNNDTQQWLEINADQLSFGSCIRIIKEDGTVYQRPDTRDSIFVVTSSHPFIEYNDLSITFMMTKEVVRRFEKEKLSNDETERPIMEVLKLKRNPTQAEYKLLNAWINDFYSNYQLMYA